MNSIKKNVLLSATALGLVFSFNANADTTITKEALLADLNDTTYTDGSFDINTGRYSFGCVLISNGNEYVFKKCYERDEYSPLRNVAGEIKGAGFIINYAINHNIKELHLYYDYIGIEKWYMGEWKAKSDIAIKYQAFASEAKSKIHVYFHKVKSHTNDHYNEIVDKLAKEALGIL